MPAKPSDVYNPVPEVAAGGAGSDFLRVQATPNDFGAQIGEAMQRAGAQGEQVGTSTVNLAIQRQGMINETLATNAETQYMTQLGAIMGKYKSSQGLDAVNQLPQVTSEVSALRQKIMEGLPSPMAQKAFTTLALRHEGYALQDANTYSAQQIKKADTDSAHASMTIALGRTGDLAVASDDKRFNDVLQDSDFAINRILINQGYGPEAGTGFKQDARTGEVSFDETTSAGQQAKAVYTQMQDQAHGAAWENRLKVLADQNVIGAWNKYQQNRDQIPGETQAKLEGFFAPKIRSAQASFTANSVLSQTERQFQDQVNGGAQSGNVADAIRIQESGGRDIQNPMQIQPATWAQYAKPGENINNKDDNLVVGKRIVDDLSQKFGNDPARIAVGYFSGPGNVAPAGSPTPWLRDTQDANGKSVSSYVADVTGRVGQAGGPADQPVRTRADFYRANYANIIDQARHQAERDHPDDPVYAQQASAKVEQRLNDVIRQQELSRKADSDLVYQAFNGDLTKNQRPTSVEQLTAINPQVKDAWDRMQADNPQAALAVETRLLTANAKATGHDLLTYGSGFYRLFSQVHADPSSTDRITDPAQLYGHVGDGGDLTVAGLEKLTAEINGKNTPDAVAEGKVRESALTYAKHQLSFEADYGTFKIRDPKGEDAFNARFVPAFFKAYDEGRKEGKTPYQMLSKDSPDFIVDKILAAPGMRRTSQEYVKDRIEAGAEAQEDAGTQPDLTTQAGIVASYRAGKLTREAAADALVKGGFAEIAKPAPEVPLAR